MIYDSWPSSRLEDFLWPAGPELRALPMGVSVAPSRQSPAVLCWRLAARRGLCRVKLPLESPSSWTATAPRHATAASGGCQWRPRRLPRGPRATREELLAVCLGDRFACGRPESASAWAQVPMPAHVPAAARANAGGSGGGGGRRLHVNLRRRPAPRREWRQLPSHEHVHLPARGGGRFHIILCYVILYYTVLYYYAASLSILYRTIV